MNDLLIALVCEIVEGHPNGITHSGVVRAVLDSGYSHTGQESVSRTIHAILQNLRSQGVICRNEKESGVRNYACVS